MMVAGPATSIRTIEGLLIPIESSRYHHAAPRGAFCGCVLSLNTNHRSTRVTRQESFGRVLKWTVGRPGDNLPGAGIYL